MSDARGSGMRSVVHYSVLPIAVVACALASSPWLRSYPSAILAVPLFGAALLSVLVPVVAIGIGVRRLWQTALIDVAVYVFFAMLVALREPFGFLDLYSGVVHGPAQILSFALPLVSPRTLLVAPVTLCWVSGAILGECIGRAWHSVVPYATLLVAFGLAYGGTARAISSASDGRRYDTVLAGTLLLALLVMRAAQAWVEQDLDSEASQPDGALPLRGLVIGVSIAVLIAVVTSGVVQSSAFTGPPTTPSRAAPLDQSQPLSPVDFVAGVRPKDPRSKGTDLFSVRIDRRTSGYIEMADVDSYDGDGWSFSRTFRPSGGVVPAESDPGLRAPAGAVQQQYTIDPSVLTGTPWMPSLYRPERVTGASVDVDSASGMVVPSGGLRAGERYTVASRASPLTFGALAPTAQIATSTPTTYTAVPPAVSSSLGAVVTSFVNETGATTSTPIGFLQALASDLRTNYALSGLPVPAAGSTPSPLPTSSAAASVAARPGQRAGGTSFANVLASILGPARSATPEQYATLVALVARQLGVPARLAAGFRIGRRGTLPAGKYDVTTADAWTWVEIPIQGRGWVVLNAAPARYGQQRAKPSGGTRPSPSQSPSPTPNGLVTRSNRDGHAVAGPSDVPGSADLGTTAIVLLTAAGLVAFGLIVLLLLLLRKRLRVRRRQRAGDPRLRVIGAWQESLDVLVEAGMPDPDSLTGTEVAAIAGTRFGAQIGEQVRYLGNAANAAIFSTSSWLDAEQADAAWRAEDDLRRGVRKALPLRERTVAALRYHRGRRHVTGGLASASSAPHRVAVRRARRTPSRHRVH